MPKVLVFDLKADMAHFRLPDTTATHASYPFAPRTVLHGLLSSILGLPSLDGESMNGQAVGDLGGDFVGLKLMAPVRSSFQKLSMLGKAWASSGSDTFSKPVSIEVIARPHYRIYYAGRHYEQLESMIKARRSKYHTYLGSCFCPIVPLYVGSATASEIGDYPEELTTSTVVPSSSVDRIVPSVGMEYARAGGFHYKSLGNRQFRGTLNMIYEVNGKPMTVKIKHDPPPEPEVKFLRLDTGEVICLW